MAHAWQCVVFSIKCDDSTAITVGICDLKGCFYAICFPVDLVTIGEKGFKECADVVVGVVFFKCQLWVRPDL